MTAKERVLTACDHQEPDRIPIQCYLTPEVEAELVQYFGGRDVEEALSVDLRMVRAPYIGQLQPGPGVPGKADSYDLWGAGFTLKENAAGGTYSEATELPLAELKTLEDVENYPWPSAEDYDYSVVAAACDAVQDYAVCFGGTGIPDILNGVSRGRGMEQVVIDIATADPVGRAIIDRRVEHLYEYCRRGLEIGEGKFDILCLGEDCGHQGGRTFSPACFDRAFRPRLKKFIDLAHDYGALAMLHSCGDTHELMPTFIEMGLDILDAMQPEPPGMVPAEIKRSYGDKLTFCGLISTQYTLPRGTVADVRREVRERIEVIGKGGGYILAPAHCIQPDTPLENVLALYSEGLGVEL